MTETKKLELESKGRLDKELAKEVDLSRSKIQTLIKEGNVKIAGETITDKSRSITGTTKITIVNFSEDRTELVPKNGPLDVLYEDETILVLNKPSGLLVHPTSNQKQETLANRILYHYPSQSSVGAENRAGLVHRLDRGTSGVILVARDNDSYSHLKQQFRERTVKKTYMAILKGPLKDESILVEVPIGRHNVNPTLRQARPDGKQAETRIKTVSTGENRSAVKCYPKTGRTHQIRVHCSYLGHPIVGDDKYGSSSNERLQLHASEIIVEHPHENKQLNISAEPPSEVKESWTAIQ